MKFLANMGINKNIYYFLILISPYFLFGSCKKNKGECLGSAYSLKESWNISPQKDSINVGDTLIFSSTISTNPFDYNSMKNVDFSTKTTMGTSLFLRSISLNNLKPAIDSFSFFILKGTIKPADFSANSTSYLQWSKENNTFELKFGIVAKKKGDYSFTLPDALGRVEISNLCESGINIYLTNSNVKNNAYLSRPYYSPSSVPSNDSLHMFCIRVK